MRNTISEMGECLWEPDEDGNWKTECGQLHILESGTPTENKYEFCPYCGRVLVTAQEEKREWRKK